MLTINQLTDFKINPTKNYEYTHKSHPKAQKQATSKQILPNFHTFIIPTTKTKTLSISFLGHTVHIVDAGNHADYMKHFATAINHDMDIDMHFSEENPKYQGVKQLKSLEEELKHLNDSQNSFEDEYIAVPALASVPILNLTDQYEKVMGKKIKLTPENIKAHKKELLKFLKEIYENPEKHTESIKSMDSAGQEIEYTYGVIQQINKLKNKGAKIYVPSGHPHANTLKWAAGQKGVKEELYHYIATGNDTKNVINKIHKDIKDKLWYDFNLLSLSEANVVGVKGTSGAQDYMFAAYDACITDGARGVYNLSPVRTDSGKIVGYSFTDTTTIEYPLDEFPHKEKIKNIAPFVGKKLEDVLATDKELSALQRCIIYGYNTKGCADKLYPINQVISQERIKKEKLNLKGQYTTKDLNLFFSVNSSGEIIFPKCDCEGSGKPSVYSMWGSCFAVFNAISRDINNENSLISQDYQKHSAELKSIINKAKYEITAGNIYDAIRILDSAIFADKAFHNINSNYIMDYSPYYMLGNIFFSKGDYNMAAAHYNNAINLAAEHIVKKENLNLDKISLYNERYEDSLTANARYNKEISQYNKKSFWGKLFSSEPEKPWNYYSYTDKDNKNGHTLYINHVLNMVEMYEKLAQICTKNGENYPAKICTQAALCLRNHTDTGELILQRRSDGVQYIGDLFENEG